MNGKGFWLGLVLGAGAMGMLGQWGPAAAGRDDNPSTCIPAGAVAEYLHSVIQADRTFYTTDVVERMQMRGIAFAAENWRRRPGFLFRPNIYWKPGGSWRRDEAGCNTG